MLRVAILASLLIVGLVASQLLPWLLGSFYEATRESVSVLAMVALAYVMIQVGREFDLDKTKIAEYGRDYAVAATAAAFPWLFVATYFVLVMLPTASSSAWKEGLLTARFAAPTSAGVLFGMLAAAGLAETWGFKKARFLAIFDDLDTVLLMVALKIMVIGMAWELLVVALLAFALLWLAWAKLRRLRVPSTWPWVLLYAVLITALSEALHHASTALGTTVPLQMEVLLPAFVLGCVLAPEPRRDRIDLSSERRVAAIVCGVFMLLVGLGMPLISATPVTDEGTPILDSVARAQPMPGWDVIALHVLAVTFLSNLGKLFPALFYRGEASRRERLALAISLWPRGEVGAGVLFVTLSYGVGGPMVTVALLSLALNLILTGPFIGLIKWLVVGTKPWPDAQSPHVVERRPSQEA